jgi:hypothetical protein
VPFGTHRRSDPEQARLLRHSHKPRLGAAFADRRRWFAMRTLIDPRHANRVPVAIVNRRHARARRQVLRELDRLGEKRRAFENESR